MSVIGPVELTAADGYWMLARDVSIDLPQKRMVGTGGIQGAVPAGTFSADRLIADLDARTVTLDGHARLHMIPGKLRMP
jgi:lipopolysaccharide export system protein LptC